MTRVVLVLLAVATTASGARAPTFTVVATGLDNPRKVFVGSGGAVYVTEAGSGGSDTCTGTGANATCVGRSGAVTEIVDGRQQRVVTGLVSWATPSGVRASGPAAVVVRGSTYYVLLQDGFVTRRGTNALGPDGATAGKLVATRGGVARPKGLADFAAFEALHNPDRGAGPGPTLGNPSIDSDPYAFVPYRGGFAVVDAGANDLLWLDASGRVSVLAVFPTRSVKLTKTTAEAVGLPPSLSSIVMQAVPSCVAVGPDGALYVGELTGRPFPPGKARVWRVVPGRKPEVYAAGFTNISDLAFDGRNLLVLEIAAKGLTDPNLAGALLRVAPGGHRSVVIARGLTAPTGIALSRDSIYISDCGVCPSHGGGPHGRLVAIPR
jgi:hypothetical protein